MIQKLGEKINRLRRESEMSQEKLAEKLNVSRQAVSKWELGSAVPELENVLAIARLFDVTCDYLMSDEMEEISSKNLVNQNEIPANHGKHSRRMKFLTDEQWKMVVPPFMGGLGITGIGLLIRLIIDRIFITIFDDIASLTGAGNVVYTVLTSCFFFLTGLGVILGTASICLMIGFFIYNRTKH